MASQPVATVYVRGIEERIKPDRLKEALTAVFSEYGNVIDIVAKTNLKAKGQAFVVFDSPDAAKLAAEEVDGFELFSKPISCALAKTRSDATVLRSGNDEEFDLHRRRRLAEKDKKKALEAAEEQRRIHKRPAAGAPATAQPTAKAARGAGLKPTGPAAPALVPDEYLPPNKILFVQQLPDDFGVEDLTAVFGRFEGFREVRLVPGRRGIAFVEYDGEAGAITAKENTMGMAVGEEGRPMKVTYQRQ